MMHDKRRMVGFALVAVTSLILSVGCKGGKVIIEDRPPGQYRGPAVKKGPPPWAPAHGHRAKYRYRYYPSSYVYFDVGRRLYFYYDAGTWQVAVSLPSRVQIDFNDYVTLEMGTDRPHEYHAEVVKRYPPGQQKKLEKGKQGKKW